MINHPHRQTFSCTSHRPNSKSVRGGWQAYWSQFLSSRPIVLIEDGLCFRNCRIKSAYIVNLIIGSQQTSSIRWWLLESRNTTYWSFVPASIRINLPMIVFLQQVPTSFTPWRHSSGDMKVMVRGRLTVWLRQQRTPSLSCQKAWHRIARPVSGKVRLLANPWGRKIFNDLLASFRLIVCSTKTDISSLRHPTPTPTKAQLESIFTNTCKHWGTGSHYSFSFCWTVYDGNLDTSLRIKYLCWLIQQIVCQITGIWILSLSYLQTSVFPCHSSAFSTPRTCIINNHCARP